MSKTKPSLSDITQQEVERFWSYVNRSALDECWEWDKCTMTGGYGAFTFQKRTFKTHRIAYYVSTGIDPGDLCVCHHCDNPKCCNPTHLFLGTNADNSSDRDAKGRVSRGPEHMAHRAP
jgi:hypothetical protein